jgi:hypothetical protein
MAVDAKTQTRDQTKTKKVLVLKKRHRLRPLFSIHESTASRNPPWRQA